VIVDLTEEEEEEQKGKPPAVKRQRGQAATEQASPKRGRASAVKAEPVNQPVNTVGDEEDEVTDLT